MDVGLDGIIPIQVLLAVIHLPALHHLQPLWVVPSELLRLDLFSPFLIIFLVKVTTQWFRVSYRQSWCNRKWQGNLTAPKDASSGASDWNALLSSMFLEQRRNFASIGHYSGLWCSSTIFPSWLRTLHHSEKTSCFEQNSSIITLLIWFN